MSLSYNSQASNEPVKVGLVGAGKMASLHARVLASSVPGTVFTGVYDPDTSRSEELAKAYSYDPPLAIESFQSFEELLENSDALIIASATDSHFEQALAAVTAGKHVLIEKPVCSTPQQARELEAAVDQLTYRPKIQVGHIEHFNPSVVEALKFLDSIDPLVVSTRRLGPHDPRTSGTDVVSDLMLHDIHVVLQIAKSEVASVNAVGIAHTGCKPDYAHATLTFEDGMIAQLTASRITEEKQRVLSITSSNAHLTADYSKRSVDISHCSDLMDLSNEQQVKYKQESIIQKLFVPFDEPLASELRSFVESIKKNYEPKVSLETAVQCMNVVEQINNTIQIQERKLR